MKYTDANYVPIQEAGDEKAPRAVFSIREASWLIVLAACLAIVYFSPLGEHLKHVREINDLLEGFGAMAVLIFIAACAVVIGVGFPRMLLYPIGGVAFGFWGGLIWTNVGVLIGGYGVFCYARWGGRNFIVRKWPRMGRVADFFGERSFKTVALLRLLPAPGFLTNVFLGITHIKHRSFLLGTAIGSIPPAIPATLIGSSVVQDDRQAQVLHITLAVIALIALWTFFSYYMRRSPKFRQLRESLADTSLADRDS